MAVVNASSGSRSRVEVASERQAKWDATWEEIKRVVSEFHAQLPRDLADAVGAAYARYSSRFQDSVVDQIRTILADALRKKVFIPLDYIFLDLGVRGAKADRPGLNRLCKCLATKSVQVVFFFSTNRLFRKTYRSLQFVEEQVVERRVRAVFVKSGIDTADGKRWRGLLNFHAMLDEFVVGMTADHIRAAQEGLLEKRLVFGTISFGYGGEPIPGTLTRRGLPRKRLVIDPVAASWVKKVFDWFVADRVKIDEIVRRLNSDPSVPPPLKSPSRVWTRGAVRKLLSNSRYRGCWRYGVTESVWVSSKDYVRQVTRKEPLKEVQIEELRLVPDKQWFAAHAHLAKEAARVAGRKPSDGDTTSRPRLLNGLFFCSVHGRKLYVGGVNGKYMVCVDCRGLPADKRPLFSQLPRALALRKTCEALAKRIRTDTDLVTRVIDTCRRYAAERHVPGAERITELEARRGKLDKEIGFILRNPGVTDADQNESETELRRFRRLRAEVQAELDSARSAASAPVTVPSEEELRALIEELESTLVMAASGPELDPEGEGQVRDLIDLFTGGRIDLVQMGEPKAHQGWLQGQFRYRLIETITSRAAGVAMGSSEPGPEVCIDFRTEPATVPEQVAKEVTSHYETGKLVKEIARLTALPRNAVTRILDDWYAGRGLERPDGRSRRSELATKHVNAPTYQEVADKVKAWAEQGLLFGEIAERLDLDRNTVTAAWRFWHESRGLPVADGRGRRKSLTRKQSVRPPADDQVLDRHVESQIDQR